ncbi:phthalate transporter protein [Rutstroemia sp. NJR-2017a WRK4]|nr:phthalate transporter protein [Rutstroemia sp. NJR-2017a WRK4]
MKEKPTALRFSGAPSVSPSVPTSTASSSPTACSPTGSTSSTSEKPSEPRETNRDFGDPSKNALLGWPSVTQLIVKHPDFEAFQIFKDLNIKSLLYYQAELEELRRRLHILEHEDPIEGASPDAKDWARNLSSFVIIDESTDEDHREQWELVRKIRSVLKEYNEALLQYSHVSSLPKADPYNVETCRRYLKCIADFCIAGPGAHTWGNLKAEIPEDDPLGTQFRRLLRSLFLASKPDPNKLDLVVPRAGHKVDGFTRWVATEFVPFWVNFKKYLRQPRQKGNSEGLPVTENKNGSSTKANVGLIQKFVAFKDSWRLDLNKKLQSFKKSWRTRMLSGSPTANLNSESGGPPRQPLTEYSGSRMLAFTSGFATVLACLLPTVAIAVLSRLDSTRVLIGVIAAFTAIFAIGLMWLTDAGTSRVEIFTATAASYVSPHIWAIILLTASRFSAVMVVFVQNQNVGLNATGPKVSNCTYSNITHC